MARVPHRRAEGELVRFVPAKKVEDPVAARDRFPDCVGYDHGARRESGVPLVESREVETEAAALAIQEGLESGDGVVPVPENIEPEATGGQARNEDRSVLRQVCLRKESPASLPQVEQDLDVPLAALLDARAPEASKALHGSQVVPDFPAQPRTWDRVEVRFPAGGGRRGIRTGRGGPPLDAELRPGKGAEEAVQPRIEHVEEHEVMPIEIPLDVLRQRGEGRGLVPRRTDETGVVGQGTARHSQAS